MAKTLGIDQFLKSKKRVMPFEGAWRAAFGQPAYVGAWIIWGASGSGKTRFALQLCKELTKYGRVAYDSLEEGDSLSLQRGFQDVNMLEVSRKIILLDRMPMDELTMYLKKRKSPNFVLIDSLQYTGLTYRDYLKLRRTLPNKLFIFISHANGKEPKGNAAQSIRYDCDCKVRVEGFRALVTSRFAEGIPEPYTVWAEGAERYWGRLTGEAENSLGRFGNSAQQK